MQKQQGWLWAECLLIFGLGPVLLYYLVLTPPSDFPIDMGGFEPRRLLFPFLWLLAIGAMLRWRRKHRAPLFGRIDWAFFRRTIVPRFALSALLMMALVGVIAPERLFQLPQEKPLLWMMIMVFYPLISVLPQEVLFRLFFFDRYAPIFAAGWPMLLASGLAFGHAHLPFNNVLAYGLSIIGGIIFAHTYSKTRSLSLACIEHAIYGQCVFTVGLGWYFYTGAAASHGV